MSPPSEESTAIRRVAYNSARRFFGRPATVDDFEIFKSSCKERAKQEGLNSWKDCIPEFKDIDHKKIRNSTKIEKKVREVWWNSIADEQEEIIFSTMQSSNFDLPMMGVNDSNNSNIATEGNGPSVHKNPLGSTSAATIASNPFANGAGSSSSVAGSFPSFDGTNSKETVNSDTASTASVPPHIGANGFFFPLEPLQPTVTSSSLNVGGGFAAPPSPYLSANAKAPTPAASATPVAGFEARIGVSTTPIKNSVPVGASSGAVASFGQHEVPQVETPYFGQRFGSGGAALGNTPKTSNSVVQPPVAENVFAGDIPSTPVRPNEVNFTVPGSAISLSSLQSGVSSLSFKSTAKTRKEWKHDTKTYDVLQNDAGISQNMILLVEGRWFIETFEVLNGHDRVDQNRALAGMVNRELWSAEEASKRMSKIVNSESSKQEDAITNAKERLQTAQSGLDETGGGLKQIATRKQQVRDEVENSASKQLEAAAQEYETELQQLQSNLAKKKAEIAEWKNISFNQRTSQLEQEENRLQILAKEQKKNVEMLEIEVLEREQWKNASVGLANQFVAFLKRGIALGREALGGGFRRNDVVDKFIEDIEQFQDIKRNVEAGNYGHFEY